MLIFTMDFSNILNCDTIAKLDFNKFDSIPLGDDFFKQSGDQHYRLLAFFSTLFNNTHIIEIGTHVGESAIALSYNENNTIYTFDIIDKVPLGNKCRENVKYIIDDIMTNNDCRSKWSATILSSAFIFLDVDPHNGVMEHDLYLFLKENNYQGFVICDDIWYFQEMRNNFWYKIEDKYKYDISHLGHWSGTGIFTFNKNIIFHKNDISNWTLFTSYFNLTKCQDATDEICKRGQNYYLSHSISTLSMPYNLVIYCDSESYNEIYKLRPSYLSEKTKYVIIEFDNIKLKNNIIYNNLTFSKCRDIIIQNRKTNPYHFDNRNTASYYLFCLSRYILMKEIIEQNPFNSTHFCWINFCIERMGYKNLKYLDEALAVNRDKFSTCYIDYIPPELTFNTTEYYKWGRCSMCSGFFTGNKEYMYKVCDLIEDKFLHYLSLGYGHADEQLYSPVYFENDTLFEHYYGDYQQMITNYKFIYESPEIPIRNFITNSLIHKNYAKCIESCEFIINSIELNKCAISEFYLECLFEKYITSKMKLNYYCSNYKHETMFTYKVIKKLLDSNNNADCYNYCHTFINYINDNMLSVDMKILFSIYFCYYVSSFYVVNSKSIDIVNKIFNLCNQHLDFKTAYYNNKAFYDEQFNFVTFDRNNIKLAYYTCFFGGENNYSYLIPPVPSNYYDCYYFTNNRTIYDRLENTNFIRVFVDDIPIYNCQNKDTMSSKKIRCMPFDYDILQKYNYLCWFDNKLEIYSDKVETIVYHLDTLEQSLVFVKHPYFDKYLSIWDEYNLAIGCEKYAKEKEQYKNYIDSKLKENINNKLDKLFLCGGFKIMKNNLISKQFGKDWYENILDCGIEDQISLYFVAQQYKDKLLLKEYNELFKYFSV